MPTIAELGAFSADVYSSPPKGLPLWRPLDHCPTLAVPACGFFGAAFISRGRGEVVVAFRGTEPSDGEDIVADRLIAMGTPPWRQYGSAKQLAEIAARTAKARGFRLYITGHSLGGGLASMVAAQLRGSIGVTFNGPGLLRMLANGTQGSSYDLCNMNGVLAVRAVSDVVSWYGTQIAKRVLEVRMPTAALPAIYAAAGGTTMGTVGRVIGAAYGTGQHAFQSHLMDPLLDVVRKQPWADKRPEAMLK